MTKDTRLHKEGMGIIYKLTNHWSRSVRFFPPFLKYSIFVCGIP